MNKLKMAFMAAVSVAIVTHSASAADLPRKAPAAIPAPTPAYNWTGFYVGLNGGYGWGDPSVSYTPNDPAAFLGTCGGIGGGTCIPSASSDTTGGIFGGQIGFNWQVSPNWLWGVETDFQWADIRGTANSPFHLGSTEDTSMLGTERIKWFGTLRARAGFLPANNLLLYATGGLAYGHVQVDLNVPNFIPIFSGGQPGGNFSYFCAAGGPPCFIGSKSHTNAGWTVGGGLEWMFLPNWTARAEYLYIDLGDVTGTAVATRTLVANPLPASFTGSFGSAFNVVRGGLNYKF